MQCHVCDQPLKKGWSFCPECGYDVNIKKKPSPQHSFEPPEAEPPLEGVRGQVFEVIVRQAMAGAPWRDICAGPMMVNQISPKQVEKEVKRRMELLKDGQSTAPKNGDEHKKPKQPAAPAPPPPVSKQKVAPPPAPSPTVVMEEKPLRLELSRKLLEALLEDKELLAKVSRADIENALDELEEAAQIIAEQEDLLNEVEREAEMQRDLDRERGAEYD